MTRYHIALRHGLEDIAIAKFSKDLCQFLKAEDITVQESRRFSFDSPLDPVKAQHAFNQFTAKNGRDSWMVGVTLAVQ